MAQVFHILLFLLASMQAVLMFVDEGVFHRRRGLERFERWGHVVDTLLFGAALSVAAFFEPTRFAIIAYSVLGFLSCIVITKDEWIHAKSCEPIEQWCHALLFVLHGALVIVFGMLWNLEPTAWELKVLPITVFAWALYQHLYWNVYYVRSRHQQ
ncbi:MAG: hypothetical protein EOP07_24485 [Proteobacteria bacterium]|nr:MAG: hypothetical protein EOP07_24485 [Pseudomonadota bacterium]